MMASRVAAGKPPFTDWPVTRELVLADTDRAAWELAERSLWRAYRGEYGEWRHPFIDAQVAGSLEGVAAGRFLIGSPDTVVRQIRPYVEQYGMTHLIVRLYVPGIPHAHVLRTLELLAREVMPAFR